MKILNDLEVAAALNDPKTVKVCRMENKFLCFTDYDQYLAFRKIATLDRGIFTAKVEELDLAEKVEQLDLAEKVEELDL